MVLWMGAGAAARAGARRCVALSVFTTLSTTSNCQAPVASSNSAMTSMHSSRLRSWRPWNTRSDCPVLLSGSSTVPCRRDGELQTTERARAEANDGALPAALPHPARGRVQLQAAALEGARGRGLKVVAQQAEGARVGPALERAAERDRVGDAGLRPLHRGARRPVQSCRRQAPGQPSGGGVPAAQELASTWWLVGVEPQRRAHSTACPLQARLGSEAIAWG